MNRSEKDRMRLERIRFNLKSYEQYETDVSILTEDAHWMVNQIDFLNGVIQRNAEKGMEKMGFKK